MPVGLDLALRQAGFDPVIAKTRSYLIHLIKQQIPSVILLTGDIGQLDLGLVRQTVLDHNPGLSVLVLNRTDSPQLKMQAKALGYSAYYTHPTSYLVIIQALAYFSIEKDSSFQDIQIGEFKIDHLNQAIQYQNHPLLLSRQQYHALLALLRQANRQVSREVLAEAVWGLDRVQDYRALDAAIYRLRKRLPKSLKVCLEPVHGIGYKFNLKKLDSH